MLLVPSVYSMFLASDLQDSCCMALHAVDTGGEITRAAAVHFRDVITTQSL